MFFLILFGFSHVFLTGRTTAKKTTYSFNRTVRNNLLGQLLAIITSRWSVRKVGNYCSSPAE